MKPLTKVTPLTEVMPLTEVTPLTKVTPLTEVLPETEVMPLACVTHFYGLYMLSIPLPKLDLFVDCTSTL